MSQKKIRLVTNENWGIHPPWKCNFIFLGERCTEFPESSIFNFLGEGVKVDVGLQTCAPEISTCADGGMSDWISRNLITSNEK